MDCLLNEVEMSRKLVEVAEGEHDITVRELSLSNEQLVTERARANTAEASLVVTFACLDKNIEECTELHRLLPKVRGQREKDLTGL